MAWLLLSCAILTEVIATTALKYTNGLNILTHTGMTLMVCVLYITSYICMAQALKLQMEVSVAYAMWSGIGTAAITVIGAMLFRESLHPIKVGAITLIVIGVALLNLVPDPVAATGASAGIGTLTPTAILASSQAMTGLPIAVGRHRAYGSVGRSTELAIVQPRPAIAVPRQRDPVRLAAAADADRLPRHARPAWGYIQHSPPPRAVTAAEDAAPRLGDPLTRSST
jgi:small multidrug resistance pump